MSRMFTSSAPYAKVFALVFYEITQDHFHLQTRTVVEARPWDALRDKLNESDTYYADALCIEATVKSYCHSVGIVDEGHIESVVAKTSEIVLNVFVARATQGLLDLTKLRPVVTGGRAIFLVDKLNQLRADLRGALASGIFSEDFTEEAARSAQSRINARPHEGGRKPGEMDVFFSTASPGSKLKYNGYVEQVAYSTLRFTIIHGLETDEIIAAVFKICDGKRAERLEDDLVEVKAITPDVSLVLIYNIVVSYHFEIVLTKRGTPKEDLETLISNAATTVTGGDPSDEMDTAR